MNITPHVAQNNTKRRSAVDERTTPRAGSAEEKTSGAIVRVDEDGQDDKESEVVRDRQGGVAAYLCRGCLQPVPIAKPDGQSYRPGRGSQSIDLSRYYSNLGGV
jgi:hypothetical protein